MALATKSPIVVLSFNRPDYLKSILVSLSEQDGADLSRRHISLFQDGAKNPYSKRTYAEQSDIDACISVFKQTIPHGTVFAADANLGIALNYDRAERHVFETLNADAAIFLEDDLLLSPQYIATLDFLVESTLADSRVGYLAAYGDHLLREEAQHASQHRLTTMHHNWGFALFNRQWKKMRSYVTEYLALVKNGDYRLRDHGAVTRLFASWGFGAPATSQDAAKTLASCLTHSVKVNTSACFARYIGERGVHMNANDFRSKKYAETYVFPHAVREFETISDRLYQQMRADLVNWAGRPGFSAIETDKRKAVRELFHATNDQARANQHGEATRSAVSALTKMFEDVRGRGILAGFYPRSSIRDCANENHIRFDLRPNSLRILCPADLIGPAFTNYLHAFSLAASLIESGASSLLPDGGFTFDIGSGSDVGTFRRVAFSSALPQTALVIDPEFYRSGGFSEFRETCRLNNTPWKNRAETVYWRGNSTGIQSIRPANAPISPGVDNWNWLQRLHLCAAARHSDFSSRLDVGLSQVVQIRAPELLEAVSAAGFLLGPDLGNPLSSHRHVFAIDSNSSSGNGLFQGMLSGACVLLVESPLGHRSWFYDRLEPGRTHVSIKADLSDLEERLAWIFDNPDQCEAIAQNGRTLAEAMTFDSEFQHSVGRVKACLGA
jgi:hypothetical protein